MDEFYFDEYGNPLWDTINRGIDVVGATLSHSPYISPDDPRYQGAVIYRPVGYPGSPQQQPIQRAEDRQSQYSFGSLGPGGVNISPITFLLGGVVLALIFFGKSRGR